MCPRSSLHTLQNLSVRSPTVNNCFSIEFSLSRSLVPLLGVSINDKNKSLRVKILTRRLYLKEKRRRNCPATSSESDHRHCYGLRRNRHDCHRDLREPWLR